MKPYWQRNLPDGRWHRYEMGSDRSRCTKADRYTYSPAGIEGISQYPTSGDVCGGCSAEELHDQRIPTLNTPEPAPLTNTQSAVWDLVLADMAERNLEGIKKYGTPLQAFNGRRPLVDAYQEVLDLTAYMRQEIEERKLIIANFLLRAAGKGLISEAQHEQLCLMEVAE